MDKQEPEPKPQGLREFLSAPEIRYGVLVALILAGLVWWALSDGGRGGLLTSSRFPTAPVQPDSLFVHPAAAPGAAPGAAGRSGTPARAAPPRARSEDAPEPGTEERYDPDEGGPLEHGTPLFLPTKRLKKTSGLSGAGASRIDGPGGGRAGGGAGALGSGFVGGEPAGTLDRSAPGGSRNPYLAGWRVGAVDAGAAAVPPVGPADGALRAAAVSGGPGAGEHSRGSGADSRFGAPGSASRSGGARGGRGGRTAIAEAADPGGAPAAATPPAAPGAAPNQVDPRLQTIAPAASDPMQRLLEVYPWLQPLKDTGDLQRIVDAPRDAGIWGTCFDLRIYSTCHGACVASGGKCTPLPGGAWAACKEALGSDGACAAACRQQPGGCPSPPGAAKATSLSYVEISPPTIKAGQSYTLTVIAPEGPYQGDLDALGTQAPNMTEELKKTGDFMPKWSGKPAGDGRVEINTAGFEPGRYCGRFAPSGSGSLSQEVCITLTP